jgi:hypothetical protein
MELTALFSLFEEMWLDTLEFWGAMLEAWREPFVDL